MKYVVLKVEVGIDDEKIPDTVQQWEAAKRFLVDAIRPTLSDLEDCPVMNVRVGGVFGDDTQSLWRFQ